MFPIVSLGAMTAYPTLSAPSNRECGFADSSNELSPYVMLRMPTAAAGPIGLRMRAGRRPPARTS